MSLKRINLSYLVFNCCVLDCKYNIFHVRFNEFSVKLLWSLVLFLFAANKFSISEVLFQVVSMVNKIIYITVKDKIGEKANQIGKFSSDIELIKGTMSE